MFLKAFQILINMVNLHNICQERFIYWINQELNLLSLIVIYRLLMIHCYMKLRILHNYYQ